MVYSLRGPPIQTPVTLAVENLEWHQKLRGSDT
jgi:hypothetical protein